MSKPPFAAVSAVAVSCMLVSASHAATTTIDFSADGAGTPLAAGTTIASQYASIGVTFVGSAFADPLDPANPFATNTDMKLAVSGGDVPAGAVIPSGAGNFLHAYTGWTQEDGESNFAILFDTRITSFSMDVYDDRVGLTQLFAIDGDNIVDLAQTASSTTANPQTITVSKAAGFDAVGVVLGSNVDWVAVDNLRFTSVPEPTSMLAIGSLAFAISRRPR
jgi:hypothetical protein